MQLCGHWLYYVHDCVHGLVALSEFIKLPGGGWMQLLGQILHWCKSVDSIRTMLLRPPGFMASVVLIYTVVNQIRTRIRAWGLVSGLVTSNQVSWFYFHVLLFLTMCSPTSCLTTLPFGFSLGPPHLCLWEACSVNGFPFTAVEELALCPFKSPIHSPYHWVPTDSFALVSPFSHVYCLWSNQSLQCFPYFFQLLPSCCLLERKADHPA